jgi:hypothetical protein
VDAAGLAPADEQLESFVGEVFSSLGRKDRRAKAGLYIPGPMLDGQRRKSMQPMAARLRVDHQQLQQFVTSSPWDVTPAWKALSGKACALIAPDAWVIDATGFRQGRGASVCVARQYSPTWVRPATVIPEEAGFCQDVSKPGLLLVFGLRVDSIGYGPGSRRSARSVARTNGLDGGPYPMQHFGGYRKISDGNCVGCGEPSPKL